jgi:tetratricopeptide (TPR) repeat protein
VYHDVNVPDAPVIYDKLPESDTTSPEVREIPSTQEGTTSQASQPAAEKVVMDREEAFYASLKPAQLSFVLGMIDFKSGGYSQATESFYNASLEDPDSRIAKLFVAVSLFSVGEYRFAAEYLRLGLDEWESFSRYRWDLRNLYGNGDDFRSHLALLEEEVALHPSNLDALLVLGFVSFSTGETGKAALALDALRSQSSDPIDQEIAGRYLRGVGAGEGAAPQTDEDESAPPPEEAPVKAFLTSLSLADVPALPIR